MAAQSAAHSSEKRQRKLPLPIGYGIEYGARLEKDRYGDNLYGRPRINEAVYCRTAGAPTSVCKLTNGRHFLPVADRVPLNTGIVRVILVSSSVFHLADGMGGVNEGGEIVVLVAYVGELIQFPTNQRPVTSLFDS